METVEPAENEQNIGSKHNNIRLSTSSKGVSYQAYQVKRRSVLSSPEHNEISKFTSPEIPRSGSLKVTRSFDSLSQGSIEKHNSSGKYSTRRDENVYSKNPRYQSYSPIAPEVSLPGGIIYKVANDRENSSISNSSVRSERKGITSPRSERSTPRRETMREEIRSSPIDHKYITRDRRNNIREQKHHYDEYDTRKHHSTRRRSLSPMSEEDSIDSYGSDEEAGEQRKRERIEEKARKNQMMDIIIQDYFDRKRKEKEDAENKTREKENKVNSTPKPNEGSYQIPKPEPVKQKIPNYEDLPDENKLIAKNGFIDLYQKLKNSYPEWTIDFPDFNNLPLRLIHERYEKLVKDICVYQTAMKWKVYLIIIIAGIEYYGYNVKGYTFLRGLLKQQIKGIHKYNSYLIEIAEMFYSSDETGEDWPLWMRFLGTIASSLTSFCGISGLAKAVNYDAPDFAFEQADKFMSPPEGTAKLRTDGISDLPEPPRGFQNPDTIIGVIGKLFSTFTGQGNSASSNSQGSNIPQATAQPVNQKKEQDDDYTTVDF